MAVPECAQAYELASIAQCYKPKGRYKKIGLQPRWGSLFQPDLQRQFLEIKMAKIFYSIGINKFDNCPKQLEAASFDEFEKSILAYISPAKGNNYFAGPLSCGPHDDSEKYPEEGHYRLASHALPRRFLATDQDGYRDVAIYEMIISDLTKYRGFGYTTWSHTNDKPRTRIVFELSREVTRAEGILLGKAFDRMLKKVYGEDAITQDASAYQNEQPCYSPGPNATIFHFSGEPLDVDDLLNNYPEPVCKTSLIKRPLMSKKTSDYARLTADSLIKALEHIDCEEEPIWHSVGNALARAYGEDGREFFIQYSRGDFSENPYEQFDLDQVNDKYDRALYELKTKPDGYGVNHLIQLTGLPYSEFEFEDDALISEAIQMMEVNGTEQDIISLPLKNKNKKPLQVVENIKAVLVFNNITARYNQISKRGEILIPNLSCVLDETDNTALTTVTDLAIKAGMSANRVPEMIDAIASQNPYCPVQTYIDSIPWDGISRFVQFVGQIKCGNPALTNILLRKWLIQAIGAAYEPDGIANAGVIVLTGDQGVGKTRLFIDLTSGVKGVFLEGQTLNPADKDSVMSAASHWIVELGELDATFKKADVAQLKAFITRKKDTLRRPYARKDSSFPRRTVFAGTVNDFQFLHDPTGNRRFWPIDVHSITRSTTINYQQLWAEVKSWYESGERWFLNATELVSLNQYSETFLVSDPDVEVLLSHYDFFNCTSWKAEPMNTICAYIRIEKPTKSQQMRLAEAIRKFNGGQNPKIVNGLKHHYVPDMGLKGRSPVAFVGETASGT
jgi:predicted P-loop ATPase